MTPFTLPQRVPGSCRLYLVRHGRTDHNRAGLLQGGGTDAPLDGTGKGQADVLGEAFRGIPLQGVFTSPLRRAKDTALVITRVTGAALVEDSRLEEMHYGSIEGKSLKDPQARQDVFRVARSWEQGSRSERLPGQAGECYSDVAERMRAALRDRVCDGNIVFVGHLMAFRVLLAELSGRGPKGMNDVKKW
eukprot:Hpha_TRINITY_DN36292_c0_g1::TRINITY_DN36292_c0_g1_i1::g.83285::m.83285/K15634/gpmB; probable phosphoglycerate mutase